MRLVLGHPESGVLMVPTIGHKGALWELAHVGKPRASHSDLAKWFSTFLMLKPLNIVSSVAMISSIKLFGCYF